MSIEDSELHKSKRQLLELLEHKDLEISEKNATIKSYLDKIVSFNFFHLLFFFFLFKSGDWIYLFFINTLGDFLINEKMGIPKRSRREKKKGKKKESLV